MTPTLRHSLKIACMVLLLSAPLLVLAQNQGGNVGIKNPLGSQTNVTQFIKSVIKALIQLGSVVAVIAVIYAGFLFVTAQGDEKKITDAKRTLLYALIGTAILLGASALTDVVVNTVKSVAP